MKKVIFGSSLVIGGILLTTLSIMGIKDGTTGFITAFPVIGLILFAVGFFLGIKGIQEDD